MEDYLIGIGKRIKEIRKNGNSTISDVGLKAGVTAGLISRIENGRTIPSLPVLLKIISALNVEVSDFFSGLPETNGTKYIITRKADNAIIEKEDEAIGFSYSYIFGKQLNSLGFEAVLLQIHPDSKRDKVMTDAFEFKYLIEGECHYIIAEEEIFLKQGDSIFFDGRIPHVPENRGTKSAIMLVLYFFI